MEKRTYATVLQDIKEHPDRHQHRDTNDLMACCYIDGAIDLSLQEAHERVSTRTNGGKRCDVISGPCSCGAWH